MFFGQPGQPTKLKKIVYLSAATVLGLLFGLLAHAIIEMSYLKGGRIATFYGSCALPPWLQAALWIGFGTGGFLIGRLWWRYLYIDRIWEKKCLKNKKT